MAEFECPESARARAGAAIPAPAVQPSAQAEPYRPIHASLDRASLMKIATAANGLYLELDRESDHEIAGRIIDTVRRRAKTRSIEQVDQDVHWPVLVAAACVMAMGIAAMHEVSELWLYGAGLSMAALAFWLFVK